MLLGYSRQSYYQAKKDAQRKTYEAGIVIDEVLRIRKCMNRLGTRKLLHEMQDFLDLHCFSIGRDAFFELLRENNLLVRTRRRRGCQTTFSKHRFKKYPNIIRGMVPLGPNQLWVADITYLHVGNKWMYLSLLTDAYSHKIVGFYLSKDLSAVGPLKALEMALKTAGTIVNLIHHSDRGVQYCCDAYVALLNKNGVKISMTEKGDPLENAIAERVNGILKTELLKTAYPDSQSALKAVAVACATYNYLRPHNSVNNLKPVEAHLIEGAIPKLWKNYYQINKQKKEDQPMKK